MLRSSDKQLPDNVLANITKIVKRFFLTSTCIERSDLRVKRCISVDTRPQPSGFNSVIPAQTDLAVPQWNNSL